MLCVGVAGTAFAHDPLRDWLAGFPGPGTVYADSWFANPVCPGLCGSMFSPHETVKDAVLDVASGGTVSIVTAVYPSSAGNTFTAGADGKAMTLEAPVGVVTIGN